jgi:hypothetical protein
MGIKSTTTLKRSAALLLKEQMKAKLYGSLAPTQTNERLAVELDSLAEALADFDGNPCFDNYLVEDD